MINITGRIRPLIRGLDWPEFDIQTLTIDNKGRVKVEGGWQDLAEAKKLDFYGFSLELTKLGFGTVKDTGERWIGLNGNVKLPLPAGASVEGLRIRWDPAKLGVDPNYLPTVNLNGVGVQMNVPRVFWFDAKVDFFEDINSGTKGFRGDIKLQLEA